MRSRRPPVPVKPQKQFRFPVTAVRIGSLSPSLLVKRLRAITSITVTSTADFAVGEFGINAGSATTCASEGYTGTKLNWCKIICESESSSSTIDTYLRRWINKYRDLPYCAVEGGGEEPPPQEG